MLHRTRLNTKQPRRQNMVRNVINFSLRTIDTDGSGHKQKYHTEFVVTTKNAPKTYAEALDLLWRNRRQLKRVLRTEKVNAPRSVRGQKAGYHTFWPFVNEWSVNHPEVRVNGTLLGAAMNEMLRVA